MSAIFGMIRLDGAPASREELAAMAAAMAHRGPDGAFLWQDSSAGLGQLLLRVTAEEAGATQPLIARHSGLVAVADARLDNRDALIAALELPGTPTDVALILAAYERWGEGCPEQLLGDFAFAIWDPRRRRLFLARDHFGVRPLSYYRSGRLFAFATEVRGVLGLPEVPRRLNEVKLADFLGGLAEDSTSTFFEDIVALEPAHSMTVTGDGVARRRYWALDPSRELRLGSDAAYAEGFREHFRTAVARRLRAEGPVGAMLSGGLDSSAIVCQARALLAEGGGGPLHSFGAVFPGLGKSDEHSYLEAVVAQGGLEHHRIDMSDFRPLSALERLCGHFDEPVSAGNLAINVAAYERAARHKLRVILDGFDGDTTVSHGRGHLHTLARTGQVRALWVELAGLSRHYGDDRYRSLLHYLWGYQVARPMLRTRGLRGVYVLGAAGLARARRALGRGAQSAQQPGLLAAEFAQRTGFAERQRRLAGPRSRAPRDERHEHHRRLTWGAMVSTVELLNKTAAMYGVELRFPFWDRDLVAYCLALPPEQKLRRGWTRLVMRHALEGLLPAEVQWRGGKADLTTAFEAGMATHERERVATALGEGRAMLAPYIDLHSLTESYDRFLAGTSDPVDSLSLFRAVSLAQWLRQHMPGTPTLVRSREGGPIDVGRIELSAG